MLSPLSLALGDMAETAKARVLRETAVAGVGFCVVQGDITDESTEAIVNAANGRLWLGGGVAGAIARKGGLSIESECKLIIKSSGQVSIGQVAVTSGGRLRCRAIIHAVGPVYKAGRNNDSKLREVVLRSLRKAEELGLASVALPAISSGIFGFPKDRCAAVMVAAFLEFAGQERNGVLRTVKYVSIDAPTAACFVRAFDAAIPS